MNKKLQLCLILEMEFELSGSSGSDEDKEEVLHQHALAAAQGLVERGEVVGKTGATLVNHRAYVSPFVREFAEVRDDKALFG